ncbi:DNA-3-methyladenine glycosylase 2 family protein [Actinacidiphila paucisporea]|uniref:DNA-3-methyladenine glycosylase II n=1 Tax=Actinacidiphila paucisporea TaxID=310782 RepID=A0A1M7A8N8_9ACTN|nr:AlkA N-terminal domain-containing protein [Actinacidiphila paucisporea]SHL39060.1 DNA-3-methyladenine glycosylase II [Actinacidiphila paucisporea]
MTEDSRYEAVRSRDARFDGAFFFAVSSTGIYCRPSCPAITPKRANVSFFPTAAAAQGAGFRACRRCRPDAVPGSADWNARADVVGRAIRLIGDGIVDREGVAGLATRLGYSARQVQRQLNAELGAGPIALARAQRGHTARVLLQTTSMQAAEIAFAAGFASVRQFNETIREIYAATPTELRAARPGRGSRFGPVADPAPAGPCGDYGTATGVPLRLAYRGAYDSAQVFDHLAARAVAGVEEVTGEPGTRTYRRTLRLPHGFGVAEVEERPGRGGWLECRLHLGDLRDLTTATQRVRRLFDLDADPYAVAERLGADPELAASVARRPGLRAPGTADPEEYALRAVIGDAAVSAAVTAAHGTPLAAPSGGLTHLFPRPADLAEADLTSVSTDVRDTVRAVSAALAGGALRLDPGADRDEAERMLLALPGVTPRMASAIRMRALGDPDVLLLPGSAPSPHWRPWRTYATHHVWSTTTPCGVRQPCGLAGAPLSGCP